MWEELDFDAGVDAVRQSMGSDRLIVMAGAGISKSAPAECPTWIELIDRVVRAGAAAHHRLEPLAGAVLGRWKPEETKTEAICQLLHANLGTKIIDAFNSLVRGAPNQDHVAIATLAAESRLRAVITTNFDGYIEEALDQRDVQFDLHVGSPPRRVFPALATKRDGALFVLKPHGSITDAGSMMMTMRQVGRPPGRALSDVVKCALRDYPVLVAGYSANDDDFFPLLVREASAAKRVFWAAWDQIDRNVPSFARRSPRCSIVRCGGKSLLGAVAGVTRRAGAPRIDPDLQPWAGAIDAAEWTNFFSAFLMMLDPTDDDRRLILEHAQWVRATTKRPLLAIKAQINGVMAVLGEGEESAQRKAVDDALQSCLAAARPREYIELVAAASEHISLASDSAAHAPLHQGALYAGNSFDPYLLGLYMYAEGIHFSSGKPEAARDYLLRAAGYLLRAGDGSRLRKCLLRLAGVVDHDFSARCRRQADLLEKTGSVVDDDEPSGRSALLDQCELAAAAWTRKSIAGELVICFILALPFALAGAWFTRSWTSILIWFGFTFVGGIIGKIIAARRIRKYPPIDR